MNIFQETKGGKIKKKPSRLILHLDLYDKGIIEIHTPNNDTITIGTFLEPNSEGGHLYWMDVKTVDGVKKEYLTHGQLYLVNDINKPNELSPFIPGE